MMGQYIVSLLAFVLLVIAFVVLIAWLNKKPRDPPRPSISKENLNPRIAEIIALSKLPSQMQSYDPDWVLRYLLQLHDQFFAPREMKRVLAYCVPHEKEVYAQDRFFSFNWFWIVELLPGFSKEIGLRFAFVAGWFDPRLWEPTTHLHVWFFSTPNEALECAITRMEVGKGYIKPNKRLYEFLSKQLQDRE